MRVRWTLFDLNAVSIQHLKANLEYWKWDMVFEAQRMLDRLEQSRVLKLLAHNKQVQVMIDTFKAKGQLTAHDINNIINYDVKHPIDDNNGVAVVDLYVNPIFFTTTDMLDDRLGRRVKKIVKAPGRQELIRKFEKEFRKLYTHSFSGEILEDDGKQLTVAT